MKFEIIRQQVPVLEIARYLLEPGRKPYLFYWPGEQEPSIKVYLESNSFFDFGRGIGGDAVKLWTHVSGCDAWTAAQAIASIWEIELEQAGKITAEEIKCRQRANLRSKRGKERAWRRWRREVDYLKSREQFYNDVLASPHLRPLSDPWCICIDGLQKVRYRLDCLCEIER